MNTLYILAVWAHIFAVAFWVGAMFFADPESTRFFSRLFERKLRGVGWYAQAVLWTTGLFTLWYRGWLGQLFSSEFVSSAVGRALWVKLALVLFLVGLQIVVGNRPSKAIYGYILSTFVIIGISVMLVRPVVF